LKGWVPTLFLSCLVFCLLTAGAVCSGETPLASDDSDDVFLWLAGGLSDARVARLAQSSPQSINLSAKSAGGCERALLRAGADRDLIQQLLHPANANTAGHALGSCATPAAEIAALIHEKNLVAAEAKTRKLLENGAGGSSEKAAQLHFVLGTILRQEEKFDEANDEFSDSAHLAPGFPETHNQLAREFYRNEDSDNALAEARTALSLDPANAEAYRYLGLALYSAGHYDAAVHALEEALTREPETSPANAEVYFDIGLTRKDQGDLRLAAAAYRHALTLRPDYWQAHSNLGVVFHDEGKLDEAIAEYRAAKRIKPDEISVRNNLGNTLCDKEEFDAAIAEFNDLYRQSPNWEGGHNCLARAYMSKRNYPAAIRELRAAIAENPAGAVEYRVLGQALLLTGRDEEAVSVLRQAITLNPESSLGHHYLGTALVNTQLLAEAEKEFREALRLEPSAQNHYSLAACLVARDQYEEALGELEIASRMDPQEGLYRARMQEVVRLIAGSK
jgi:tetratricopeptide (TPR) repeat protein